MSLKCDLKETQALARFPRVDSSLHSKYGKLYEVASQHYGVPLKALRKASLC